jgi:hypothetical protein
MEDDEGDEITYQLDIDKLSEVLSFDRYGHSLRLNLEDRLPLNGLYPGFL